MALLELQNVSKRFPIRPSWFRAPTEFVHAVTDVSLTVDVGETVAIVGESGCGKSTLARLMVQLLSPDTGDIRFRESSVKHFSRAARRPLSRDRQLVFQDPAGSLNPRWLVRDILEEPLIIHRLGNQVQRADRVHEVTTRIGLSPALLERFPHELSGGQRQRINIARAVLLQPALLIADEPVSALDLSVQGEILNLLLDLQAEMRLGLVLITHDLRIAAQIAHRVAVMYLGRVVEVLAARDLLHAQHPYTRALLAAVPMLHPQVPGTPLLAGDPPSPIHLPSGCAFAPRCPRRQARCDVTVPPLEGASTNAAVACYVPHRAEGASES